MRGRRKLIIVLFQLSTCVASVLAYSYVLRYIFEPKTGVVEVMENT